MQNENVAVAQPPKVAALTVSGVTKSFGQKQVLRGVDFELFPGEVLGLVGQNGAGKSTLASLLSGSTQPENGTIQIEGGLRETVGIIEQLTNIPDELTVAEALFRNSSLAGSSAEELQRAARPALFETGIALDLEEKVANLSNYDKRLLEVVRILADPRPVTVMDEVGEVFNAREMEDLHFTVQRCVAAGGSLVYITHNLSDALRISNRIAVLRDGVISTILDAKETSESELSEAIYDRVFDAPNRVGHATERVVMSVRSLSCKDAQLSFDLHAGEVLGFVGSRSSGLDQLFGALSGKSPRQCLSLTVNDELTRITSPQDVTRNRIGIISGTDDEDAEEFFARNLMLGASDASETEIEFAKAILLSIRNSEGVGRKLLKRPSGSTGQQRRKLLAQQVAQEAVLLVLHDPTNSLDLPAQEEFWQQIEQRTADGLAVILLSSNEAELQSRCDRLLVLHEGRIVEEWNPANTPISRFQDVTCEAPVYAEVAN